MSKSWRSLAGECKVHSNFWEIVIQGKIVAERGFVYFLHHFEIRNLSTFNMSIVNRSVEQRMAQKYYDSSMVDIED